MTKDSKRDDDVYNKYQQLLSENILLREQNTRLRDENGLLREENARLKGTAKSGGDCYSVSCIYVADWSRAEGTKVVPYAHTAATMMLKDGVHIDVVSQILGHASVAFTLKSTDTSCGECRSWPWPGSIKNKECLKHSANAGVTGHW